MVALPATLVLLVANIALITADLVAISSGLELLTHIPWPWFVVPVVVLLWYLVVYSNFNLIKKIFVGLSLAFIVYLICQRYRSGSHANFRAIRGIPFCCGLDWRRGVHIGQRWQGRAAR
jgi:Mn2+/Fe2+ NRAMP family transporter